jgi:hypothetical protein
MPTIFDNQERRLLEAIRGVLADASAADFCVGYLHLRGWHQLSDLTDRLEGAEDHCCTILVGMHRAPDELSQQLQSALSKPEGADGPTMARLKRETVVSFRKQIEFGLPTAQAEATLRQLARQLRAGKVRVKLFLGYPLHAKLYLVHRSDRTVPLFGFVGSSNLTFAGLSGQGELNVDVVEQDAAQKLHAWFHGRAADPNCIDISAELADLIEDSWAGEQLIPPHLVYLKMAYHLSEDARLGEQQFKLAADLEGKLLDFQKAAVQLAARRIYKTGGVLLGDVVGLGKTMMAAAVARVFQDDDRSNTLVICPPKLKGMWQRHIDELGIAGRPMSLGDALAELPALPGFRTLIIDESHNLRERGGKRYQAIRDYIDRFDPRVILISATPYNKQFTDLSAQLRLFLDETQDLGVRPERFLQWWATQGRTEADFRARHQAPLGSLRAFDQSPYAEDWRDLMRLFLVRRKREFIIRNYAAYDTERERHYVTLNGAPYYFPLREPKRVPFRIDETDPADQYARLLHDRVVHRIEHLALPRYGLANYLRRDAEKRAKPEELAILANLNRAGRRLIGFCRTNLFKRLESSGYSFLLSVERHVLRNMVTLYALEQSLPVPIGTQDAAMLDSAINDADTDLLEGEIEVDGAEPAEQIEGFPQELQPYLAQAQSVYESYRLDYASRFRWLSPRFFRPELREALREDAESLVQVLQSAGQWNAAEDVKLAELERLLSRAHRKEKVLVFTQFADTAQYLARELQARGLEDVAVVTNQSGDPVALVRRFSPKTNGGLKPGDTQLRVLVSTDVLSEGQNLQDCHIVVNYDLPWAIIRLIQRAGRVDRIGQVHDTIPVYSFLPAEGVERLIALRARLAQRLRDNQEVIGTDESFFGEQAQERLRDLYTEKAGALDDDPSDEDVDLTSVALQVWNSAAADLRRRVEAMPPVVYATREHAAIADDPAGTLVYLRLMSGTEKHDLLVRLSEDGRAISHSMAAIFRKAACPPEAEPREPLPNHHELVAQAVQHAMSELQSLGGQVGTLRSIRRKVYDRLRDYRGRLRRQPDLFSDQALDRLDKLLDVLFRCPMREGARDKLSRQLKLGIPDEGLVALLWILHGDGTLCDAVDGSDPEEPQILCSLGLRGG